MPELLPLIAKDSPLRRLPVSMSLKQALFFDGMRQSAEMAGLAYSELLSLLIECCPDTASENRTSILIPAMTRAYTIVDSIHRFRRLANHTPRLSHGGPYELFRRRTEPVERIRNIVQHLYEKIEEIGEQGLGALGTLTFIEGSAEGDANCHIIQPGVSYGGQKTYGPVVDTWADYEPGVVTNITISTAGVNFNLTEAVTHLGEFVESLEQALDQSAGADVDRMGSGLYSAIKIRKRRHKSPDPATSASHK